MVEHQDQEQEPPVLLTNCLHLQGFHSKHGGVDIFKWFYFTAFKYIGLLYLYFWQIAERSASAVTSHCSPINTTSPSTPVGAVVSFVQNRQRSSGFQSLHPSKSSHRARIGTGGTFPGVMNWTQISLRSCLGLDRKFEMSLSSDICPPSVPSWYLRSLS